MIKKLLLTAVAAALTLALITFGALAHEKDKWAIIHAGTLMSDARQSVQSQQSIVVKNGRIFDIRKGYISASDLANDMGGAKDVKVIDLKDQFVMAGMIDSHTHVTGQMEPNGREKAVTVTESELALIGTVYGRRILNAGFTTIRNVGGPREAVSN